MRVSRQTRILLLAGLLLSNAFSQPAGPLDAIASALHDKAFARALDLLQPALRESPADPRLWAMRGAAYAGEGNTHEALAAFQRALEIAPNYVPALRGAAQIDYDNANPVGIPLLKRLLRLNPKDVTGHGMLAVLEYQHGDCNAAVVHFGMAASLFESQVPALQAYGACLVKLRRLDQAVGVFERTLALNPGDHQERRVLAALQLMDHRPEEAVASLDPLLSADPDASTLDLASAAYEATHQAEKAEEALRKAIRIDPRNVSLYVGFSALAAAHHLVQAGIDVVDGGIGLQPDAAPLYFARGVLYVQVGEYDRAEADFDRAYNRDPKQSLTIAAQGLISILQNDPAHAEAAISQKLARTPNDPVLLYLQAELLMQQGAEPGSPEFTKAMRSAKRAIEIRPTLAPGHDVLGKLYLQSGDAKKAAVECRKAVELDPKNQSALYHLIQSLRKTDDKNEIPEMLKRLASLRQHVAITQREQDQYKLVEGEPEPK